MDSYNIFSSNDDDVSPSIQSVLQFLPLKVLKGLNNRNNDILFMVPHLVRAWITYKDIKILSFYHTHTHTHTHTLLLVMGS